MLAFVFGIVFQYFTIAAMRGLGLCDGPMVAARIDTLSLLVFEVGMFAWMGLSAWLFPGPTPTTWSY